MASHQELQVQQKRQVEKKEEATIPARVFVPTTDIFETDQALTVVLEMPGVDKESVSGFNPGLLSGIVLAGANKPATPGRGRAVLLGMESPTHSSR